MELTYFINSIKRNKKTVTLGILVFFVIAMTYTFIQPLEYSAKSRLLIVQNSESGLDPYVATKSNDYLGNVLSKVIISNSFFEEVKMAGFNINQNQFGNDTKTQMERWQRAVKPKAINDFGIIDLTVYNEDKYQAEQIAQAINLTLKNKNYLYHSLGEKISIKVIDQPMVSEWPVRPNILLNALLGLTVGLSFSLFYIYLFKLDRPIRNFEEERIQAVPEYAIPEVKKTIEPKIETRAETATVSSSLPVNQSLPASSESVEPTNVQKVAVAQPILPEDDLSFDDIMMQGDIRNVFDS